MYYDKRALWHWMKAICELVFVWIELNIFRIDYANVAVFFIYTHDVRNINKPAGESRRGHVLNGFSIGFWLCVGFIGGPICSANGAANVGHLVDQKPTTSKHTQNSEHNNTINSTILMMSVCVLMAHANFKLWLCSCSFLAVLPHYYHIYIATKSIVSHFLT